MKVTAAEQSILVARVLSRLKMEKVRQQLRQEVETLKTAQQRMVQEKEREGQELRENIEESNLECRERLEQIMRQTSNSIKSMEWRSNKRQIQMKDKILELVGKRKELCKQHWAGERESRTRNLQLEAEVKALLDKYDEEMFELHEKIQELESKWAQCLDNCNLYLLSPGTPRRRLSWTGWRRGWRWWRGRSRSSWRSSAGRRPGWVDT